jgi:superoxide dismutase
MTKLHHTEYKKNYEKYILDCVELDCEEKPIKTDNEKIKYIFNRFNSEFGWNIDRIGKHKAMTEWLSGLALNIEYYNDDIVKLAIKMGSIEENPSEKLQARVIDNYWSFMANIILGFKHD